MSLGVFYGLQAVSSFGILRGCTEGFACLKQIFLRKHPFWRVAILKMAWNMHSFAYDFTSKHSTVTCFACFKGP